VRYGHGVAKGPYLELLSEESKLRLLSQTCPRRNAAQDAGGSRRNTT
jgi:hypothetical protein